jgi:CBS-domain-containing membrane protein
MLTARGVMRTNGETVTPDDVARIPARPGEAELNGYPVVEEVHRLLGIVARQDVLGTLRDEHFRDRASESAAFILSDRST